MKSNIQQIMTFALSRNGRVVHIDEVVNGIQSECVCPACKKPLIAKNSGVTRAHHFAHEGGSDCKGGAETIIHLAAKQILADYKKVTLPKAADGIDKDGEKFLEFETIHLEYPLLAPQTKDRIVADCYGRAPKADLIIEIAVHHFVDTSKACTLNKLKIPAIEINLSDQVGLSVTWTKLTDLVLFDTSRRSWIIAPFEQTPESVAPLSVMPPKCGEWVFSIGAVWIWVSELPFGNLKVFHRYNDDVRRIVEPICRARGYWNAKYKNWIIYERHKKELLEILASSTQTQFRTNSIRPKS